MIKKPLFATINTVIFPNSSSVFILKRDFSIAAVKEALAKHHGQIIIVSQMAMSAEKPGMNEIFHTGCLCQISNQIELPDGTIKFAATAKSRFKIENLVEESNTPYAVGTLYPQVVDKKLISTTTKEKMLGRLKSLDLDIEDDCLPLLTDLKPNLADYDFIMAFAHFLKHDLIKHRELTFEEKNAGVSILDVLSTVEKQEVNQGMAAMQEILESNDFANSAQKMEKMLQI